MVVKHYLTLANIPYENDAGERFDFHSLRGPFATSLARSGVSLAAAREHMRHSTVEMTAKHYTHLRLDDRATAISCLPHLDALPVEAIAQKTGTDDKDAEISMESWCPNSAIPTQNNRKPSDTAGQATHCHTAESALPNSLTDKENALQVNDLQSASGWLTRFDQVKLS